MNIFYVFTLGFYHFYNSKKMMDEHNKKFELDLRNFEKKHNLIYENLKTKHN